MAEREAALGMIDDVALGAGASFGTDKAYNAWRFTQALKDRHLVPHVALRSEFGWGGVKIVPPPGYEASQRCRKRIEDIFGWVKTVGGLAKTKFRGLPRVAPGFDLVVAAYNLVRLPKRLASGVQP